MSGEQPALPAPRGEAAMEGEELPAAPRWRVGAPDRRRREPRTPARAARFRSFVFPRTWVCYLTVAISISCKSDAGGPGPGRSTAVAQGVYLAGDFQGTMKPARGRAEIVRRGPAFELKLRGVHVASNRPLRVYLVGDDRASTTRRIVESTLKYDMAELAPAAAEQVIVLPGEPDPSLRSVVLWDPLFAVNLAFAALHPVGE